MALTAKGKKILRAMRKRYGPAAEGVFYGAATNGTIRGVWTGERRARARHAARGGVRRRGRR